MSANKIKILSISEKSFFLKRTTSKYFRGL